MKKAARPKAGNTISATEHGFLCRTISITPPLKKTFLKINDRFVAKHALDDLAIDWVVRAWWPKPQRRQEEGLSQTIPGLQDL
ncbi:MAG TPA: hypothetical protein VI455_04350 [Terriglobia bacterium]